MLCLQRGQTLTEIALIIGVVGLALMGMEVYLKRGIQAKVKGFTNYVFDPSSHSPIQREEVADKADMISYTSSSIVGSGGEQGFIGGGKRVYSSEATSITGTSDYTHTDND